VGTCPTRLESLSQHHYQAEQRRLQTFCLGLNTALLESELCVSIIGNYIRNIGSCLLDSKLDEGTTLKREFCIIILYKQGALVEQIKFLKHQMVF